ncbi:hypothetical protein CSKR_103583 [Clonorchis sinensis]|uniref:Uncharacterized protein n=1 Tax=Clonorchis sinensis TaxID=79923 RepID=A0A3R7GZ56_CLOSI|nr:hypothetical protein CSKR_103583 [Clonorchis sinensis]
MLRCPTFHGCTWAGILSGRPHLNRRMIRVLTQSLWLKSLTARQRCLAGNTNALPFLRNKSPHVQTFNVKDHEAVFIRPLSIDQPGMRDFVSVAGTPPVYLNGSLRCASRSTTVRSSIFVTVSLHHTKVHRQCTPYLLPLSSLVQGKQCSQKESKIVFVDALAQSNLRSKTLKPRRGGPLASSTKAFGSKVWPQGSGGWLETIQVVQILRNKFPHLFQRHLVGPAECTY